MPSNVKKSGLMAKLGNKLRDAVRTAAKEETRFDTGGRLPAGIEGGVAKLVDCKFVQIKEGKENAGEYMFYAAGVVVRPKEFKGLLIGGMRTQISEYMFDTPKRSRATLADHVSEVVNQMRLLLGVKSLDIGEDELEATAATVKEEAPYFKFRTWSGSKQEIVQEGGKWYVVSGNTKTKYNSEAAAKAAAPFAGREPMVNEVWGGKIEYTPEEGDDEVEDNTEDEEETSEETEDEAEEESSEEETEEASDEESSEDEAEESEDEAEEEAEDDGLDAVAEKADNNDKAAAKKLAKLAAEAGVDKEDVDNAGSWTDVVEMIRNAGQEEASEDEAEEEAEEEPEEETPAPKVGDLRKYKPKGSKKALEYKVAAVNTKKETVDLRNLTDHKVTKGVAWGDLV